MREPDSHLRFQWWAAVGLPLLQLGGHLCRAREPRSKLRSTNSSRRGTPREGNAATRPSRARRRGWGSGAASRAPRWRPELGVDVQSFKEGPADARGRPALPRRTGCGSSPHPRRPTPCGWLDISYEDTAEGCIYVVGVLGRCSRRGNCQENTAMESFWSRLKRERVHPRRFAPRPRPKPRFPGGWKSSTTGSGSTAPWTIRLLWTSNSTSTHPRLMSLAGCQPN